MQANIVKVHVLNGSPARTCDESNALATLASMLGCDEQDLRVNAAGYVALWTFQCAGEIVGRVERIAQCDDCGEVPATVMVSDGTPGYDSECCAPCARNALRRDPNLQTWGLA